MHADDTIELTEQGNHRWLALYYPCILHLHFHFVRYTGTHLSFDLVYCTICVSIYGNIYIRDRDSLPGFGRFAGDLSFSAFEKEGVMDEP